MALVSRMWSRNPISRPQHCGTTGSAQGALPPPPSLLGTTLRTLRRGTVLKAAVSITGFLVSGEPDNC